VARAARLARQAARLIYAAYVGALSGPTLLVLWGLVLVLPARAADRLTRLWSRAILLAVGCPTRVEGLEHLDAAVPAILAPNHASYIDAVVLLATLPVEFVFVAKRELIGSPVVGAVIEKVGHLTVERADPTEAAADAERATQRLRAGVSLVVFPEGTFARPPGLLPFRLGAFKSAVETRRPVVPIGLRGTRAILPADTLLPTPGPIRVVIGPPLTPRGDGWPEMVRLRDLARAEIARLADERPVGRAPA
jgi:1-acyl-sn-glycerol-3-phosphate acyltransferase